MKVSEENVSDAGCLPARSTLTAQAASAGCGAACL